MTVKPVSPITVGGQTLNVDNQAAQEKIRALLEEAGLFAAPEPKRPSAQATLQAELVDGTGSSAPALGVQVRFRVTIRPSDSGATRFSEDIQGTGEVPLENAAPETVRTTFQRLLERTSEDLVKSYVARQKLWAAPAAEIDTALRSDDADLRVEALRVVAARKLTGHADAILRLLSDEDENVRDAALGAVVALREQRAVKVLTASRSMRDTREMQKILNAIALLGGQEAKDYLAFVAQNHDDEDVRNMAKRALERVSPVPARPTK